ncbi:MAG: hypothetical protein ACOCUS_04115 [Polyangiales bacterium]
MGPHPCQRGPSRVHPPRSIVRRLLVTCALLAAAAGCTKHDAVDVLMAGAHRPDRIQGTRIGPFALLVARPRGGAIATIPVAPDSCTLLRARVDGGESAHVYVGCPLAGEADDEGSP